MKIFITAILIALLTACGSCEEESNAASDPVVVVTPQPVDEPPVDVPVQCSSLGCPVSFCPFSTAGCPPSPHPYTPNPIKNVPPDATPMCVRDTTPLVFVDPFWVDNCGNKYGQITI